MQYLLDQLIAIWKIRSISVEQYILKKESETDFIHCYLKLSKKINLTKNSFLDVQKNHPKITGCDSSKAILAIKSTDNLTNTDLAIREKSRKLHPGVWSKAIQGVPLTTTVEEKPAGRSIIDKSVKDVGVDKQLKLREALKDEISKNIKTQKKKRHVWIWGDSTAGKTSKRSQKIWSAVIVMTGFKYQKITVGKATTTNGICGSTNTVEN